MNGMSIYIYRTRTLFRHVTISARNVFSLQYVTSSNHYGLIDTGPDNFMSLGFGVTRKVVCDICGGLFFSTLLHIRLSSCESNTNRVSSAAKAAPTNGKRAKIQNSSSWHQRSFSKDLPQHLSDTMYEPNDRAWVRDGVSLFIFERTCPHKHIHQRTHVIKLLFNCKIRAKDI